MPVWDKIPFVLEHGKGVSGNYYANRHVAAGASLYL